MFIQFSGSVWAEYTALEQCKAYPLNDRSITGAVGIGSNIGEFVEPGNPFAGRLIGAKSITTVAIECRRSVQPDQVVQLDFELYLEPSNMVGKVTLNGLEYGIYTIRNQNNLGAVVSYTFPYTSASNPMLSDISISPTEWVPLNYSGVPSEPNIKFKLQGNSYLSWPYRRFDIIQYGVNLVWLGALPLPLDEDLPYHIIAMTDIELHVGVKNIINGSVTPNKSYIRNLFVDKYFPVKKPNNACTTPPANQLVRLPMVWANEFADGIVGTTRGETNFDLTFSGCDRYMHAIRYKFYSTHPADNADTNNAALGLVSLNNQPGSASGIKVQILDRNTDTPITLDQFRIAPQYTDLQTGFTIPFKARYYQTENQVTAGKVRATAFFQIIYQ